MDEGKILPLIDGSNHVKAISVLSQVNIEAVKMLVQHLVHYRLVKIIDLFRFSNIYIATPRLAKLAHRPSKQMKYLEYLKTNVTLQDESLQPALNQFPMTKLSAFLGCLTRSE